MVIVDTSAWVEFFRHQGDLAVKLAVRGLLDEFEATLCGPVELEFLGGARRTEKPKLQAWFNILPYARNEQKIWRTAADLYSRMRAKGLTVPWNDTLIAAITLEQGCRVYAIDNHFTAMSPILSLPLYQPGYGGTYNPESN